jgi:RNA polymerase sigma factor (sigma-70 family)
MRYKLTFFPLLSDLVSECPKFIPGISFFCSTHHPLEPNRNISSLPDIELLALFKQENDKKIVGILFKRYTHLVMGICMKYMQDEDEAKDCVMEIFEKLLTDLSRHEIHNFKSWLHSVTRNHCLMKFRARKNKFAKRIENSETTLEVVEMNELWHPEDSKEKEAALNLLEQGIQQLNDHQKKCIGLFYLEEKSYQEIVDLTGYSMLNVKSHIQNGKRNLKIFMEKNHVRQS